MLTNLIKPIKIGKMSLRNRMVMPAMGTNLANADGTASDMIVDYYSRRANGGVGLIITEVCTPEPGGRCIPGELEASSFAFCPGLSRLARAAHSGGAKIALQLAHAGCFASKSVTGIDPISPSGIATAQLPNDTPVAMTIEDIKRLVDSFGMAAMRGKISGFDAIELHGAHGYMPLQFMSKYTNRRTDGYGGSLENRARFALECIASIKQYCGQNFPIIYRLSGEEDVPNGITLDEAIEFAKLVEAAGVDAIHVSAGTWDSRIESLQKALSGEEPPPAGRRLSNGVGSGMWVPPMYTPRGSLVHLAAAVKQHVSIPIIAVGSITPEMGEEIIATGKADLIALGRQIIADPDCPNKVIADRVDEIRPCVRCNECLRNAVNMCGVSCSVNAEAAKEHEAYTKINPASVKRKVMVAGGGPGGMEAARVAAVRGHDVTLYEKNKELGGMLNLISKPDFKKDYRELLRWQKAELDRVGVRVVTGIEVTEDLVNKEKPDAIIVATGARPLRPPIEGANGEGIFDALEVLDGKIPTGQKVIVCGSGMVGAEVGMFLAEHHNKQVVLVDQQPGVILQAEIFTQWVVQGRLLEDGVEVKVNHHINAIAPDSVDCTFGDEAVSIKGDAVVVSPRMKSDQTLYESVRNLAEEVIPVGDAVSARMVINAIHEGYHAGRRV